jgi:hypothetical protein
MYPRDWKSALISLVMSFYCFPIVPRNVKHPVPHNLDIYALSMSTSGKLPILAQRGHTQTTIVLCHRSSSAARSMYVLVFQLST